MNRYGNKFGCHTPQKTEEYFNIINKACDIQFVDNSWHNDTVDSLHHEISDTPHKFIEIYLPNSPKDCPSFDLSNYFSLFNEEQDALFCGTDINELIEFINKNYKS